MCPWVSKSILRVYFVTFFIASIGFELFFGFVELSHPIWVSLTILTTYLFLPERLGFSYHNFVTRLLDWRHDESSDVFILKGFLSEYVMDTCI